MELSIEELEKLKSAILGNMGTEVECISDICMSIKELSDNAALLQKISNTIELTQISKSAENEEQ